MSSHSRQTYDPSWRSPCLSGKGSQIGESLIALTWWMHSGDRLKGCYSMLIDVNTALLHHLLDVTKAQRVGDVPAHAGEHHFQRVGSRFRTLRSVLLMRLSRQSSLSGLSFVLNATEPEWLIRHSSERGAGSVAAAYTRTQIPRKSRPQCTFLLPPNALNDECGG